MMLCDREMQAKMAISQVSHRGLGSAFIDFVFLLVHENNIDRGTHAPTDNSSGTVATFTDPILFVCR
jgi:hypothetical protein